jgi:hypothetical protein
MDEYLKLKQMNIKLTPYNSITCSCQDGFLEFIENSATL